MKNHPTIPLLTAAIAVLLGSCASMRDTAMVRDDVYDIPSRQAKVAAAPAPRNDRDGRKPHPDDYYDSGEAQAYGSTRGWYDMAYNDPHFYNYGRFGFGSGMGMGMGMGPGMGMMGWQSGWSGPGWGMGMGWGNDPWMSMNHGWGGGGFYNPWGWNDPWMWNRPMGWNSPWGMNAGWGWNRPWGGNAWNPYCSGGWGYGGYMGPWGNCYSCYSPMVIGGSSSNTVFGRRPSVSSGGGTRPGGSPGQQRLVVRDPVGLTPMSRPEMRPDRSATPGRPMAPAPERRPTDRGVAPQRTLPDRGVRPTQPSTPDRRPPSQPRHQEPQRGGGLDRGGFSPGEQRSPGGGFSPSPGDGGSRSPGTGRPR